MRTFIKIFIIKILHTSVEQKSISVRHNTQMKNLTFSAENKRRFIQRDFHFRNDDDLVRLCVHMGILRGRKCAKRYIVRARYAAFARKSMLPKWQSDDKNDQKKFNTTY